MGLRIEARCAAAMTVFAPSYHWLRPVGTNSVRPRLRVPLPLHNQTYVIK